MWKIHCVTVVFLTGINFYLLVRLTITIAPAQQKDHRLRVFSDGNIPASIVIPNWTFKSGDFGRLYNCLNSIRGVKIRQEQLGAKLEVTLLDSMKMIRGQPKRTENLTVPIWIIC